MKLIPEIFIELFQQIPKHYPYIFILMLAPNHHLELYLNHIILDQLIIISDSLGIQPDDPTIIGFTDFK